MNIQAEYEKVFNNLSHQKHVSKPRDATHQTIKLKSDNTKCLQGYKATGTLTDFIGGSIKYKLLFRKGPSRFFKKKHAPYPVPQQFHF